MSGSPIQLTFYDPETNATIKTYTRSFVPSRMLKAVLTVMKRLGKIDVSRPEEIPPEIADEIESLIVEFYGQQFTLDDLGDHTDISEMLAVFMAIAGRAQGLVPSPPPPGK